MRTFLFALLLLSAPLITWADTVYLKDGRTFDGKILEDREREIVLLVQRPGASAKMTFRKAEITRIVKGKSRFELLMEKYTTQLAVARRADTAASWETLATWCKLVGLGTESKKAIDRALPKRERMAGLSGTADDWHALANWCRKWKRKRQGDWYDARAISVNPQHDGARVALGHQKLDGKWMSPAEYEEAYAEKMRRGGFVKIDGKWHSADAAIALARLRDQRLARQLADARAKLEAAQRELGEKTAEVFALKQAYEKLRRQAAFDLQAIQRELDRERDRNRELRRLLRIERAARAAAEQRARQPK